jgi:hemerythrin superfamily protein
MAGHEQGGSGRDATQILADDHKEFLALVGTIEAEPSPAARRELADTLIAEIMRHAVGEEMFVYPAIKKHVPDGAEQVERDKEEHQDIVLAMKQMEDVDASDPRFMEGVVRLRELLIEHAGSEEGEQFPKLRAHIPHEELLQMGAKSRRPRSSPPPARTRARRTPPCSTSSWGRAWGSWTACGTGWKGATRVAESPASRGFTSAHRATAVAGWNPALRGPQPS